MNDPRDQAVSDTDRKQVETVRRRTGRYNSARRQVLKGAASFVGVVGLAGCASLLQSKQERRLLDRYEAGIAAYETGAERHNSGVVAYQSNNYEQAIDRFESARGHLSEAVAACRDAVGLSQSVGNSRAESICSAAHMKSKRLRELNNLLLTSANGFVNEEYDEAQQAYSKYRDRQRTLAEHDLRSPDAIADAINDIPF